MQPVKFGGKIGGIGEMVPGLVLSPVFVMKIVDMKFMDGKFDIKMLAFRRKPNCYLKPNGEYFTQNMYKVGLPSFDPNGGHPDQKAKAIENGENPANYQAPSDAIQQDDSHENFGRPFGNGQSEEIQI